MHMPKRTVTKTTSWQRLTELFPLPQETLILFVASSLDVVMTYSLLTRGDGGFTESNPFARYFLDRWGMTGMAYFKGAMTLLVCFITQIVARKNELLAKRVLELATVIIVVVVIYSVNLHFRHHQISHGREMDVSMTLPVYSSQ
jgi:hypothetical protein